MILGIAYGLAVFCLLIFLAGIYGFIAYKGNVEVDWQEVFSWGCVFAIAGGSVGYIITGAV